jgi:RNA polymerase sigma factor (sigma-70 family)
MAGISLYEPAWETNQMRVLVVDDDETIVEGLKMFFETEEIDAAGALDRESAEELIRNEFFAVVLADLHLRTEEDGLQLLDQIRRISPKSRVATLTACASEAMEERVRALGSTMVLRKPMPADEIVAIVREMLAECEQFADLGQAYEEAAPLLRSIAMRRYNLDAEDAEDVVQETWLLFLERRASVRAPRAWLSGTAANLCRREIRKRCRAREHTGEIVDEPSHTPATEMHLAVRQALGRVDDRTRRLCELIAVQRLSYEEVSRQLSMPIGSVGPLYIRARARLRSALLDA